MPRRGIHPVLSKMTYVFRNGASVELPSVMFSKKPIIMQVVRRHGRYLKVLLMPKILATGHFRYLQVHLMPEKSRHWALVMKALLHLRTRPATRCGRARSGQ